MMTNTESHYQFKDYFKNRKEQTVLYTYQIFALDSDSFSLIRLTTIDGNVVSQKTYKKTFANLADAKKYLVKMLQSSRNMRNVWKRARLLAASDDQLSLRAAYAIKMAEQVAFNNRTIADVSEKEAKAINDFYKKIRYNCD